MEVHQQTCQACGSSTMCNVLVREPGSPQTVFVQCVSCKELVARYRLSDYYHHGKGIESWLRSMGSGVSESGRDSLGEFERVRLEATQAFDAVLAQIAKDSEPPQS